MWCLDDSIHYNYCENKLWLKLVKITDQCLYQWLHKTLSPMRINIWLSFQKIVAIIRTVRDEVYLTYILVCSRICPPPLWTNCNDVDIVMWLLCRNKSVKMFNNLLQIKSKNTKYRNWSKCLQSTQMWQWFVWTCLSACWLAGYLASWFAPLAKCSACFGHINHISISQWWL